MCVSSDNAAKDQLIMWQAFSCLDRLTDCSLARSRILNKLFPLSRSPLLSLAHSLSLSHLTFSQSSRIHVNFAVSVSFSWTFSCVLQIRMRILIRLRIRNLPHYSPYTPVVLMSSHLVTNSSHNPHFPPPSPIRVAYAMWSILWTRLGYKYYECSHNNMILK